MRLGNGGGAGFLDLQGQGTLALDRRVLLMVQSALHAILVSTIVLGLFYYWFGVANRYVVFLYGHLGASPFDPWTATRYWMASLVASGTVAVLYTVANWFAGRIAGVRYRRYVPPPWWRVWGFSAPLLTIGVLLITTQVNSPVLPLPLAIACVVAMLVGLALALLPARLAAAAPEATGWLALAGLGTVPSLLLLRTIELVPEGRVPATVGYGMGLGSTVLGTLFLCVVTYLHATRSADPSWKGLHLAASGLIWGYLLAPLAHYLLLTPPGYRYISTASNFFASSPIVQIVSWLVLMLQAYGAERFHRRIRRIHWRSKEVQR